MDTCPNCREPMVFAGNLPEYNSKFYKCVGGCHHMFERFYDAKLNKYKFIDIYLMYKNIKNIRTAE